MTVISSRNNCYCLNLILNTIFGSPKNNLKFNMDKICSIQLRIWGPRSKSIFGTDFYLQLISIFFQAGPFNIYVWINGSAAYTQRTLATSLIVH